MRKKKVDDVTISLPQFKKYLRLERKLAKLEEEFSSPIAAEIVEVITEFSLLNNPTHVLIEPGELLKIGKKFVYNAQVNVQGKPKHVFLLKTKEEDGRHHRS